MDTNQLVSELRFAASSAEAAECIARFRPGADPATITTLLDAAAHYINQARAALAADGGMQP